ncbi:MAG: DUF4426 domain-containing protein [Gammaproteobacteria bacterium]|nr:DUF4426 domain-containing protein [Gammaproteobacteria bacterium]
MSLSAAAAPVSLVPHAAAQELASASRSEGASPHREIFGEYTLLYGAVPSATLPEEVRRRHDIPLGTDTVLLNVTVQRGGENVRAQIDATATNLAGQSRDVEMNETVANGLVSYVGIVDVAEQEVLDFELEVLPEGAAEPFGVEFREEFVPTARGGVEAESDAVR